MEGCFSGWTTGTGGLGNASSTPQYQVGSFCREDTRRIAWRPLRDDFKVGLSRCAVLLWESLALLGRSPLRSWLHSLHLEHCWGHNDMLNPCSKWLALLFLDI